MTRPERPVALVTGAAQGMGAACAAALAESHDLALLDRKTVTSGPEALLLEADVTASDDVQRAIDATLSKYGRLDVLVNAAGALAGTRLLDITVPEWERLMAINVTGAFIVTSLSARAMMLNRWGRIVHFASTAGKTVSTLGGAHYTASKHAVLGLTRAAALELAPYGITVNAVCPGLVDTPMAREASDTAALAALAAGFPISRLCQPEEVAELVRFLSSQAAGYITGAAIDINGGDLMV